MENILDGSQAFDQNEIFKELLDDKHQLFFESWILIVLSFLVWLVSTETTLMLRRNLCHMIDQVLVVATMAHPDIDSKVEDLKIYLKADMKPELAEEILEVER